MTAAKLCNNPFIHTEKIVNGWGKPEDIKPYVDPKFENNIILTATESLTMNSRPNPVIYARSKNVLVIGGSGSGKTRFFVKPNIMQCQSKDYPVSFVRKFVRMMRISRMPCISPLKLLRSVTHSILRYGNTKNISSPAGWKPGREF